MQLELSGGMATGPRPTSQVCPPPIPLLARALGVLVGLLVATGATAQTQPDAGRILQEIEPEQVQPTEPSVDFDPGAARDRPEGEGKGGARITLEAVHFQGNTVFDGKTLRAALPEDTLEAPRDLAGLRELAGLITRFYHERGYPFARGVLPAQKLGDRELTIRVVEGRYGDVTATGDEAIAAAVEGYLAPLAPGDVIRSAPLERTVLLIGDLPGVEASPTLRPGDETGTGDLDVAVEEGKRFGGSVSVDNHGNRYSGRDRVRASLQGNSLATVGDRLQLQGLYSEEDLWLGSLRYQRPLGHSGLEGTARLARTEYDLRDPYTGFTGTTNIAEAGVRYPVIRSQRTNLHAFARYAYKDLSNEVEDFEYDAKTIHTVPVGVRFDHRDGLGGGGVTYGRVTLTAGETNSDVGGGPAGGFTKVRGQINRLQELPVGFRFQGQIRGQWADTSIDSAEGFTLGGANGVRAYPQGEGTGSRGILGRIELQHRLGYLDQRLRGLRPYAFFDAGRVPDLGDESSRSIGGGGIGLRFRRDGWQADVAVSWKSWGGDSRSDPKSHDSQLWARSGYRF